MALFHEVVDSKLIANNKYETFMNWLKEQIDIYIEKYDFLAVSKDSWESLFFNAIKGTSYEDLQTYKRGIIGHVRSRIKNYINKEIEEGRTRIICNFVIRVNRKSKNHKMLIQNFFKELSDYQITLPESYYVQLKKDSSILSKALRNLGLYDLSLSELNGADLDFYFSLKTREGTYHETMALYHYFSSHFPVAKLRNTSSVEFQKLKFFLDHYIELTELHHLYCEAIGNVDFYQIISVLVLFDLSKTEKIFADYRLYKFGSLNADQSFLYRIHRYLKGVIAPTQVKVQPKLSTSSAFNQEHIVISSPKKKELENYIPEARESQAHKQILNAMYSKLPLESQEQIQSLLTGEVTTSTHAGRQAYKILFQLKEQYLAELIEKGLYQEPLEKQSNQSNHSSDSVKKTIYDYIPEAKESLEKQQLLEQLFGHFRATTKRNITRLLNGEFDKNTKEYNNAMQAIYRLRDRFNKELESSQNDTESSQLKKSEVNQLKDTNKNANVKKKDKHVKKEKGTYKRIKKTIYDFFPESNEDEEKKKIVDSMIKHLSLEKRQQIESYINGQIKSTTPEGKRVLASLGYLRKRYFKILTGEVSFVKKNKPKKKSVSKRKKATYYDYFPGASEDENKKRIVDELISSISEEKRNQIYQYILGNIKSTAQEGRQILNLIGTLRRKYYRLLGQSNKKASFNKNKHSKSNKPNKEYTLYDYIPDAKEDDNKKAILDKMFQSLPFDHQQEIRDYLANKIRHSSVEGKRNYQRIISLRKRYQGYLESINTVMNKKKINIYDFFPESKNDQAKQAIVNRLIFNLSNDKQQNIQDYLEGKIKHESYNGKEVRNLISYLKGRYQKIVDGTFDKSRLKKYFYEFFPQSLEVRSYKLFVDELFHSLKSESQLNIYRYILNVLLPSSLEYKDAEFHIMKLQEKYVLEVMKDLKTHMDKELKAVLEELQLDKLLLYFLNGTYYINTSISLEKLKLLHSKMKLVEVGYRERGLSKYQYQNLVFETITSILHEHNEINLEDLITTYLDSAEIDLKKKESLTLEV